VFVSGVQVSFEGLLTHVAKLRSVELAVLPHVVGRTTSQSLQSGVIHGYAALVDGLTARLQAELGFACEVIATGGLASLIIPHTVSVKNVDPNLTLEGLRLLHEKNSHPDGGSPSPAS
jgi:type III pantothenate kinase